MLQAIIKGAIIFAAGAGVGSFATWKIVKDKYKKIADEEIASVQEIDRKVIADLQKDVISKQKQISGFNEEKKIYSRVLHKYGVDIFELDVDEADYEKLKAKHTVNSKLYDTPDEDYPHEDSPEIEDELYSGKMILIDEESYETEALHYDKEEVLFYIKDGVFVLVDGEEDITEIFLPYLNDGTLDGFLYNSKNVAFMRDGSTKKDYRLIQLMEKFYPDSPDPDEPIKMGPNGDPID